MDILYLSSACAQKKFDELVTKGLITKMPQAQKYHHLLIEGLAKDKGTKIRVISSYPVVAGKDSRNYYPEEREVEVGVEYIYPAFCHKPFVRQFMLFANTIKLIKKYHTKDTVLICDVLNSSLSYACKWLHFWRRYKTLGIVTDVPGLTSGARAKLLPAWKRALKSLIKPFSKFGYKGFDSYLLLTEAMNDVVNKNHRPYIVIEGHSDIAMKEVPNKLEGKRSPKVLMYAGGTHKEFGIGLLVDAFISLDRQDWDLHIYGDGNYQKILREISDSHSNVHYWGLRPNKEIIDAQLKATLLVNPRVTNAEYVKYSFPSKTLECMVSGTPLLTTRLPGMPKDYYPYVFLFDEETESGFARTLKDVFDNSPEALHVKGERAKKFAVEEKNNVKQAEKLIKFLETL